MLKLSGLGGYVARINPPFSRTNGSDNFRTYPRARRWPGGWGATRGSYELAGEV